MNTQQLFNLTQRFDANIYYSTPSALFLLICLFQMPCIFCASCVLHKKTSTKFHKLLFYIYFFKRYVNALRTGSSGGLCVSRIFPLYNTAVAGQEAGNFERAAGSSSANLAGLHGLARGLLRLKDLWLGALCAFCQPKDIFYFYAQSFGKPKR